MTAPTGGSTGGAAGGAASSGGGASGSPNATVRSVHTPRPIGSVNNKKPAPKKPAKPVKRGKK